MSRRQRHTAVWLIGMLLVLTLVRAYSEFLLRRSGDLQQWFAVSPARPLLLVALSLLTSATAALFVKRHLGRRMVIPSAMVVGAITTAMHSSLTGIVVGLLVGLLLAFDRLYGFAWAIGRGMITQVLPVLSLAAAAGLLAKMTQYSVLPLARPASLLIYGFASAVAVGIALREFGRRWLGRGAGRGTAATTAWWTRTWHALSWPSLQLARAVCVFAVGILVGWQLDIYRRAVVLERVGSVNWWSPLGPRQWFLGGLWTVGHVYLGESATDRHLSCLRGLPQLRYLTIESQAITDDGCRHLADLRTLESLWVHNTSIRDRGFRHLAGLPNLISLSVDGTRITRDSLQILATLPRLDYISFSDVLSEGAGLGGVALGKALQWAVLKNCGVTDEDLSALTSAPFIGYLDLSDNQIKGPGLRYVRKNMRLATLNVNRNPLDESYLAMLSGMNLTGLMIDGVKLSAVGCDAVMGLRWLQDLSLRESGITDAQLRRLISLPYLQDAQLDGSHLSPRSLIGWRQREVTIWVEHETLAAEDITRLGEIGPEVVMVDCELTPSAVAELVNYARVFAAVDCRTQSRLEAWLDRYTRP